jgi:protein TonB
VAILEIRRNDRIKAAAAAALLEAALAYVLITGLAARVSGVVTEPLQVFGVLPDPPPPPPRKTVPPPSSSKPEGAASPPNLEAKPTEIVAPPPEIAQPVPPPVAAAPIAGTGSDPSAGAAPVAGPGTGSGGLGNGTGSGNGGNGGGAGGNGRGPRQVKGKIKDKDYPRGAGAAGIQGTVWVQFSVETDGSVGQCIVTRSSGSAELDETTCRLIQQRYRFKPARDAQGRPVRSQVVEDHNWIVHDEIPPPDAPPPNAPPPR